MKQPPLILASASPRRADLLRQIGLTFQVVPSDAPECLSEHLTASELCQVNAHRKARAVAKRYPDAWVIGADTLVYLGTRLFGKPATLEIAAEMLEALAGQTHQVVTGVCLIHLREHREDIFTEITDVRFRALDELEIRRYLNQINPFDKAGAYAIQEHGALIIEEISGSFTNVVGLPLERVQASLSRWA